MLIIIDIPKEISWKKKILSMRIPFWNMTNKILTVKTRTNLGLDLDMKPFGSEFRAKNWSRDHYLVSNVEAKIQKFHGISHSKFRIFARATSKISISLGLPVSCKISIPIIIRIRNHYKTLMSFRCCPFWKQNVTFEFWMFGTIQNNPSTIWNA